MKPVTNRLLWIFAVGQFGWSLLAGMISSWLVYYYTDATLLANGYTTFITQGYVFWGLTLIGVITACGRVFDAFTDPLIAGWSDRCQNKRGRRVPFLQAVALPFAVITFLVFYSPVNGQSVWNDVFLFVTLLLFYLLMTMYCTPYNALLAELGTTQKNRVNVSTFISFTYIAGTSVAYLVPNLAAMLETKLGMVGSVRASIGILATIALIAMLVPAFGIRETDYINATPSETPAFQSLFKSFQNTEFRHFVYADVIYFFAVTLFQTGLPFYETKLMGLDAGYTFLLMVIMTVCSLTLYLPVNRLAPKLGKKKLVIFGFAAYTFVFVVTAFCGLFGLPGLVWGVLIAVLAAVPMAILGILPQAVVADIAEADAVNTGEKREGMFFAARTFAFKIGQAVSMLVFTSVALIGSESGWGYRLTAVIAAACCLTGTLLFTRYREDAILKIIQK